MQDYAQEKFPISDDFGMMVSTRFTWRMLVWMYREVFPTIAASGIDSG